MSRVCASPLSFETLVRYWAGDLSDPDSEAVDAHVMGCAECTRASERVAAITEAVRRMIPPFVARAQVEALRARGLRIEENVIAPGVRTPVRFGKDLDLLVHRLSGLALANAERVEITVRDELSGQVLSHSDRAPFDAESGEVLIACQQHFAAFPPDVAFEVKAVLEGGREETTTYFVPHVFEARQ